MATSTFYSSVDTSGHYRLRLVVQDSQSVELNRSTLAWWFYIERVVGTWSFYLYDAEGYVNINGGANEWALPRWTRWPNSAWSAGAFLLASGSTNVEHNPDGTKNVALVTYYNTSIKTGNLPGSSMTISTSLILPTIPRATTPELSPNPVEAGTSLDIELPRASEDFTHNVYYTFFGASGTIEEDVEEDTAWNVPLTLLSQIPNSTSGVGSITVETYNGSTLIGSTSTPVTITVPAVVVPDFTTVTHEEAVSEVETLVGAYVQGISKLTLAITGASGIYGSTITAYRIRVSGQTINSQSGTTPNPLSTSGTYNIIGTITDSRGRQKSKSVAITVLPYVPPQLISVTAERALSDGTPDDEGTFVRVNMNLAVQSLIVGGTQKNELSYELFSRSYNTPPWVLKAQETPGGITFNGYDLINTYAVLQAYDVKLEVSDHFNTTPIQFVISVAEVFMHWGPGLGVGKYWERGTLDLKGQGYQNEGKALIDEDDVATATAKGIVELATNAETQTGTDSTRAVTPQGLASVVTPTMLTEVNDRLDLLEYRPQGVIPSSVVVGSGSASVAADGTVTFTGVSSISLNGVFDGVGGDVYEIEVSLLTSTDSTLSMRLRNGGSDVSSSTYQWQYIQSGGSTVSAGGSGFVTSWLFMGNTGTASRNKGRISISNPGLAVPTLVLIDVLLRNNANGSMFFANLAELQNQSSPYDGLSFLASAGTVTGHLKVVKIA